MNLTDLAWPQIKALNADIPVVIPVAALEQHGHHLPVFTDSLLLGEVVRRIEPRLESKVLFAPLMWLGNSDHHLDFPGTLSASPRTYLDLLTGLAGNFLQHGFRRIVFLNGHGGNITPGQQAIFELRQQHRQRMDLQLVFATYWEFASPAREEGYVQSAMGHACEWETSMILRIAPHLVGDYQAATTIDSINRIAPASLGWTTRERSPAGHIGSPQAASPEKGERLLAMFATGVSEFLARLADDTSTAWGQ